jgi:hypothetical protein
VPSLLAITQLLAISTQNFRPQSLQAMFGGAPSTSKVIAHVLVGGE